MRKQRDEKIILAAHGRWIAELRDTIRTMKQHLRVLEQRISVLETQLIKLDKIQGEPDELVAFETRTSGLRRRRGELQTNFIDIG